MDKDKPAEPIIAEDFDGPPGFFYDVCPACKRVINYLESPCSHCGQMLFWKHPVDKFTELMERYDQL